nr:CFF_HP1_G0031300.mRNA.1.CDS.1 [Saccharomyces cerevisiae]
MKIENTPKEVPIYLFKNTYYWSLENSERKRENYVANQRSQLSKCLTLQHLGRNQIDFGSFAPVRTNSFCKFW